MGITNFGAVSAGLLGSLRKENSLSETGDVNDPNNSKNVFSRFRPPFTYTDGLGGAAATTDAAINVLTDGEGNSFNVRLEQAFAGSAPQAAVHARGVHLQMDATAADGIAMDLGYGNTGSEQANCRGAFIVGTADPFYLRVRLDIGDVSDSSQVAVGFVRNGWPVDGTLDTYTDYAVLNVDSGTINIETRLNSGTASVTSTTQTVADYASTGDVFELEVRVDGSGNVNFIIDGAEPTVDVTNFSFDATDTVNAVLLVLSDAESSPTVVVHEWESGYLSSRGLTGITDVTSGV